MSNRAWVTLATNDSYGLGALVLAHSLRRAGSSYPAVVLITPSVTDAMRERLNAVFSEVITVDVLDSRDSAHLALLQRPELGITFTKLHCWSLTQFDKCVFLDADTLIVQNCDELFEREELSAAPDVGWPDCFNSGVFVFVPSQDTYTRLISFAQQRGSFDGGDQGLLNAFFSDWAHGDINKHLPFLYNVTSAAFYSYLPALQHYGQNLKIIHFIGATKPWLQQFNWQSRSVDAPDHLRGFLQLWWDLFVGQVHTQLDSAMGPRSTVEEEAESEPPVEIILEPPQDSFCVYAPRLDAESEFPWHHPEAQIPEAESQDQQINMSDFYDPWQNYRGNIPPWNPGSSLNIEEPENYVWDYLKQQEAKEQSWNQPYHEYGHHDNRPIEYTSSTHSHYDRDHSSQQWEHDSYQQDHTFGTHSDSQLYDHYNPHSNHHHHQHSDHHNHELSLDSLHSADYHQKYTNGSSHHTHSHVSHDHQSQTHSQAFDHSPSFHAHYEGSNVNDQYEHDNQNQSYYLQSPNESYQSYHENLAVKEDCSHHERNEYHDHGKPYPEAHIVTGDSHKHSENRFQHFQDHAFGNHTHQTQRHKTEVYRIHLDLKKQRRQERLKRIKAQAVTCTAHMNGHLNGHNESESEDEDFIPRHPYDGFYLRHISTIDSRGRKICTHEIPPTPIPSPPTSPPPRSMDGNCSSATSSEEYDTASDGDCDNDNDQTGVAGNLARVVPGAVEFQREAIDELNRRQGWEAGNIDYMGADSFANIWAKISQTLNQAPKQPSPPRKEATPPKEEPTKPAEQPSAPVEVSAESPIEKADGPTETPKESIPETVPEASAKTEPQIPPTPKSTPEDSTSPVTETAPQIETPIVVDSSKLEVESAPTLIEAPKEESQVSTETAVETPKEPEAPVPSEAPKTDAQPAVLTEQIVISVPAEGKVDSPVPAEKSGKTDPVETKVETPAPIETKVAAPAPVAAPKVETPAAAEPKVELSAPAEVTEVISEPPQVEASVPVQAPKTASDAPASPVPAAEAPAPEATPEKALKPSIEASSDSPPLATTPSKEDATVVPAAKSEERRKPVGKLQLSVPSVGDPLATPDSELEDADSLAQSIIASELRATVTAATPSDAPSPRPPLQPQRLSIELPEVPTPPVSLAQIGVKPKGKPTTAALIESSIKTEAQTPSEPSTPGTPTPPSPSTETAKKKVVKKVVKAPGAVGDAPVPPPRKKEKKPKEK